jgi:hypothetical protein
MARRRRLTGKGLLVASAGAVFVSCGGTTSGNLVAPPMHELCLETDPDSAIVTANAMDVAADGCTVLDEGDVSLTATADGFEPYEEVIRLLSPTTHTIEMIAADSGG